MTARLPFFRTFKSPALPGPAQVRAYWEGLRQNGATPQRQALDPRGLDGVLDRVFLAEGIAPGLVQIRIAGSALQELAGLDLRGMPLSCLFAASSRPILAEVLRQVIDGQSLSELDLGSDDARQGRVSARLVLLPLADGPSRRMVLGAFGLARGALPSGRLQILARRDERLSPPALMPEVAPDLPTPILQRGHLSLVHSA